MVSKAKSEAQEKSGWIGRPAGSSGSWGGDDEKYQDWYRYGEIEGES